MGRFECHSHSMYSNLRLLDSINRPKELVERAIELGLAGIAITDHESLSSHVEIDRLMSQYAESNPDFKIARGNEIYLTDTREVGQKYWHFILIAKDAIGHKMLRELSSNSWINSYYDRGMERVPTLKTELVAIVEKYGQGHLIGSTACFLPETKIHTLSGIKEIQDITSDDYVKNMYGEWEKVNFPTSRVYNGNGYCFTFLNDYYDNSFTCTADHQFLVTTNNWKKSKTPIRWETAEQIYKHNQNKGPQKRIFLEPYNIPNYSNNIFVTKEEVMTNYYRDYPRSNKHDNGKPQSVLPDIITITPELMRLFGLFLGDGCISSDSAKNKRVAFSFNLQEFDIYYNSFIKAVEQQLNFSFTRQSCIDKNKVELCIGKIEIVALFYFFFKKVNAFTKKIPARLKHISRELDIELFFGYLLADGYTRVRPIGKYTTGEFVCASVSKQLALDFKELLDSLFISNSISLVKEHFGVDGIHHSDAYYLQGSNPFIGSIIKKSHYSHKELVNIFLQAIQYCKDKRLIEYDNQLYKKRYVKDIEQKQLVNQTVCCLNDNSHSFCCCDIIAHNCLGSEIDNYILELNNARIVDDKRTEQIAYQNILDFVQFGKRIFKDDFYLEVQPARSKDQLAVNNMMSGIGKATNTKLIVTTDAHYLKKEDRWVHKAFLNSKSGDREVDSFYEYTYLQSTEEVIENLKGTNLDYYELEANTIEIYNKIENYSLLRNQHVPQIPVKEYPKVDYNSKYETLNYLYNSDNVQERYWVNQCIDRMKELDIYNDEYLERLEYEADIKKHIGERLGSCIFSYPIFLQHYIDLFWNCGSPVGSGRGSSSAGLNHYLLGVTQSDPIKTGSPFWRYLNKERVELPKR